VVRASLIGKRKQILFVIFVFSVFGVKLFEGRIKSFTRMVGFRILGMRFRTFRTFDEVASAVKRSRSLFVRIFNLNMAREPASRLLVHEFLDVLDALGVKKSLSFIRHFPLRVASCLGLPYERGKTT